MSSIGANVQKAQMALNYKMKTAEKIEIFKMNKYDLGITCIKKQHINQTSKLFIFLIF